MTTEEKLMAVQALTGYGTSLMMRYPGNWYVAGLSIYTTRTEHTLAAIGGDGTTPGDAIEDLWKKVGSGGIIQHGYGNPERYVRWNGYMWEDVKP